MNSSQILFIFLLNLLGLPLIQPLFFYIEGKNQYCLTKQISQKEQLYISYVVSGEGEDHIKFEVFEQDFINPDGTKTWKSSPVHLMVGRREYEYFSAEDKDQEYKVCFSALDGKRKILSFDFEGIEREESELANQRISFLQYLKRSYRSIEKIFRNQHHSFVRDEVHQKKINLTSNKMKWSSIIKISVLIFVCVLQAIHLKNFFKSKHQVLPSEIETVNE